MVHTSQDILVNLGMNIKLIVLKRTRIGARHLRKRPDVFLILRNVGLKQEKSGSPNRTKEK